jgi:hypothetical protein
MPKEAIGEHGFRAEVLDGEGNRIALHSNESEDPSTACIPAARGACRPSMEQHRSCRIAEHTPEVE